MANKEDRNRNYFLTIFENAECYTKLQDILFNLSNCTYAYIEHNKDIDENGVPKLRHYHVVLNYKNDRTFQTVQNKFKGAHIEKVLILSKSIQYLTHKNDKDKHQYNYENIITNDFENIKALYLDKDYPILNEQVITEDISNAYEQGLELSIVYFYLKYGNRQTQQYRQMIIDLLRAQNEVLSYCKSNNNSKF